MALVIEDGSGTNPAANSYASTADLRDYAEFLGADLKDASNHQLEAKLQEAMLKLSDYRDRWKGQPTSDEQPLDWPRADVWGVKHDNLWPSDQIPENLINAQMRLALDALTKPLFQEWGTQPERTIKEETVGPVKVVYNEAPQEKNFVDVSESVVVLLRPLQKNNGLAPVGIPLSRI